MARLILFGGSFDPIHHGHLIVARAACEALRADGVVFIPANVSPHKMPARGREDAGNAYAAGADRLAMLRLAIAGTEELEISEVELRRGGPSYTIDTVEELRRQRPDDRFVLLMGADQLPQLHAWRRAADLLALVEPAVVGRPGAELDAGLGAVRDYMGEAAAAELRAGVLATPRIEISATDIRRRVAEGRGIRFLVPPAVEAYIGEQHLYAGRSAGR